MARPCYIELPAADIAASRAFYADAFGWSLTDFGPTYAATTTSDVDVLDRQVEQRRRTVRQGSVQL